MLSTAAEEQKDISGKARSESPSLGLLKCGDGRECQATRRKKGRRVGAVNVGESQALFSRQLAQELPASRYLFFGNLFWLFSAFSPGT